MNLFEQIALYSVFFLNAFQFYWGWSRADDYDLVKKSD